MLLEPCEGPVELPKSIDLLDFADWGRDRSRLIQCGNKHKSLVKVIEQF